MGQAFGESTRDEIAELYDKRLANAIRQAKQYAGRDVTEEQLLAVAGACVGPTRQYDESGLEELEGIARGANQSLEKILAMNGLTDLRDVLGWHGQLDAFGGCSSFVIAADQTADGHTVCGQTWDLATDNMPHVLAVVRKPSNGPSTRCLTTVGCLSLIGQNEHGISVGTTNLRTTDARAGVTYLSIIHRALAQREFTQAVACITDATRSGAHYYYVAGPDDQARAIECTPYQAEVVDVATGHYVHTNHVLEAPNREHEAVTPAESSHARQQRLESLIGARSDWTLEATKSLLADRANGVNAVCRHDTNGISSNGSVLLRPQTRTVWASHGPADIAEWIALES